MIVRTLILATLEGVVSSCQETGTSIQGKGYATMGKHEDPDKNPTDKPVEKPKPTPASTNGTRPKDPGKHGGKGGKDGK